MLFEHAVWIHCVDAPERIFCVGNDVEFFVNHVATQHPDMHFFKAPRLRMFLMGSLLSLQFWSQGDRVHGQE